jgi:hypothetical protein
MRVELTRAGRSGVRAGGRTDERLATLAQSVWMGARMRPTNGQPKCQADRRLKLRSRRGV